MMSLSALARSGKARMARGRRLMFDEQAFEPVRRAARILREARVEAAQAALRAAVCARMSGRRARRKPGPSRGACQPHASRNIVLRPANLDDMSRAAAVRHEPPGSLAWESIDVLALRYIQLVLFGTGRRLDDCVAVQGG